MEERAITYQALFFRTLQLEGVFPDQKTFTVIALRHTDAKFAADLSDLPAACKAEVQPMFTFVCSVAMISTFGFVVAYDSLPCV